jgi:hypothetical protein
MKNLVAANNTLQRFAENFNALTRAMDERTTLYVAGHHTIEEQLHDAELNHVAKTNLEEAALVIDEVQAILMEFKLDLLKAGVEVGR